MRRNHIKIFLSAIILSWGGFVSDLWAEECTLICKCSSTFTYKNQAQCETNIPLCVAEGICSLPSACGKKAEACSVKVGNSAPQDCQSYFKGTGGCLQNKKKAHY